MAPDPQPLMNEEKQRDPGSGATIPRTSSSSSSEKAHAERVTAIKQDELELATGDVINASGHVQEVDRQYTVWSLAAVGVTSGSTWPFAGGSIIIALYNGGPPGILYEYIAVTVFYFFVAASLAELASAVPSSAGVFHWASVTPAPRWRKVVGFFAGWWNALAWIFGVASSALVNANIILSMYGLFHDDYVPQRWHTYVVYLLLNVVCGATVMFFNRLLPKIELIGGFIVVFGFLATVLAVSIVPNIDGHAGSASTDFVWREWVNSTGWSSNGFAFLLGMLNGAFTNGAPDCSTHLAEEIHNPAVNVPWAIFAQVSVGFVTAFLYYIAILYSISSLDDVANTPLLQPIATIYQQATSSRGGSLALMVLIFLAITCSTISNYISAGRMLWTLARDKATPFPDTLCKIHPRLKSPLSATIVIFFAATLLGLVYIASVTAFNAIVSGFVILITLSFLAPIASHLLTNRNNVKPGPFYMSGWQGMFVHSVSVLYIVVSDVVYCFPGARPVTAMNMNYACVMTGGCTLLVAGWWFWVWRRGTYKGIREEVVGGVVEVLARRDGG